VAWPPPFNVRPYVDATAAHATEIRRKKTWRDTVVRVTFLFGDRFRYRTSGARATAASIRAAMREAESATDLTEDQKRRIAARGAELLRKAESATADGTLAIEANADRIVVDVRGRIGAGWFSDGVTAEGVQRAIAGSSAPVHVRINSGGGDYYEGEEIRALLASESARRTVTGSIEGLAASAASVLAMGVPKGALSMSSGSVLMIHRSKAAAMGNADDLESMAQQLRAVDSAMASTYAARTGKPESEMADLMRAQTYFTPTRARELGFVDSIASGARASAMADVLASADDLPDDVSAILTANEERPQDRRMNLAEIAKRLGLPENATEAEVFAAMDRANEPTPPAPVVTADAIQAAVDAALAKRSKADAECEAHKIAVRAAVENAIKDLKVRPADRDEAIAACGNTADQLGAMTRYWAKQPPLTAGADIDPKAPRSGDRLTPSQRKLAADCGVKPETIAQIIAEEEGAVS
jgi:ATP-dependent protease ClpP protease subunit